MRVTSFAAVHGKVLLLVVPQSERVGCEPSWTIMRAEYQSVERRLSYHCNAGFHKFVSATRILSFLAWQLTLVQNDRTHLSCTKRTYKRLNELSNFL